MQHHKGAKDIIFYFPYIYKKLNTKKYQNLGGQLHKLFIKTNLKQIQGRKPWIQKTKYSQQMKSKQLLKLLHTKV
jgi:hypothetical protein